MSQLIYKKSFSFHTKSGHLVAFVYEEWEERCWIGIEVSFNGRRCVDYCESFALDFAPFLQDVIENVRGWKQCRLCGKDIRAIKLYLESIADIVQCQYDKVLGSARKNNSAKEIENGI